MSTIPNIMMKKSIPLAMKSKKKSIPININSNPSQGKFLISNQINQVASSYLSMGQKIQIQKNLKNSKMIRVNTNSACNYYTNPGMDSKHSITNSLLNNYNNINFKDSEISGINFNNYFGNVSQQNYSGINKTEDLSYAANNYNKLTCANIEHQISIYKAAEECDENKIFFGTLNMILQNKKFDYIKEALKLYKGKELDRMKSFVQQNGYNPQ